MHKHASHQHESLHSRPVKSTETLSKMLGFEHFTDSQSTGFKILYLRPLFVTSMKEIGSVTELGNTLVMRKHLTSFTALACTSGGGFFKSFGASSAKI